MSRRSAWHDEDEPKRRWWQPKPGKRSEAEQRGEAEQRAEARAAESRRVDAPPVLPVVRVDVPPPEPPWVERDDTPPPVEDASHPVPAEDMPAPPVEVALPPVELPPPVEVALPPPVEAPLPPPVDHVLPAPQPESIPVEAHSTEAPWEPAEIPAYTGLPALPETPLPPPPLPPPPPQPAAPPPKRPGYPQIPAGAASRVDAVLHAEEWKSMPSVMALAGLVALLIRLAYLAFFRDSLFFSHLMDDARWNFDWAEAWALGEWSPAGKGFARPPLYPYWLSMIFRLFGHDLLVVRVIQALVGSATAAAVAGAGFRLAGFGGGRAAGLLAALSGTLVFLDGELLGPNLLLALLAWSLFLFLGRPSILAWAGSGLLLGLAALVQVQVVVLVPLMALWGWLRIRKETTPAALRRVAPGLLTVMACLPPLGVTLGHVLSEGSFVLISSNWGIDFYAGNHRWADGRTADIPVLQDAPSGWDRALAARERAERSVGRALSARELSNWWFHRGLDEVAARTGSVAKLALAKGYYLVNAHEGGGNRDPYFEPPGVLKVLFGRVGALAIPWGILFPLAVVGFARGLRDPSRRQTVLFLAGWFVLVGLSLLPFVVNAETRAGTWIPLFVLAGVALGVGPRPGKIAVAAGVAALVLVNTSVGGVGEEGRGRALSKLSVSYFEAHGVEDAVHALETAHREDPREISTMYLLAEAYEQAGRAADALPLYEEIQRRRPEDADVGVRLGGLFLRLGRYDNAAEMLETTVARRPTDKAAWSSLGEAHAALGRPRNAAEAYRQSILLVPHEPEGYVSLARLYLREGEPDLAIKVLEAGVRRVRGSFDLYFLLGLAAAEANQLDRALEEIDKALELRPEDTGALRLQKWLSGERRDEKGRQPAAKPK